MLERDEMIDRIIKFAKSLLMHGGSFMKKQENEFETIHNKNNETDKDNLDIKKEKVINLAKQFKEQGSAIPEGMLTI